LVRRGRRNRFNEELVRRGSYGGGYQLTIGVENWHRSIRGSLAYLVHIRRRLRLSSCQRGRMVRLFLFVRAGARVAVGVVGQVDDDLGVGAFLSLAVQHRRVRAGHAVELPVADLVRGPLQLLVEERRLFTVASGGLSARGPCLQSSSGASVSARERVDSNCGPRVVGVIEERPAPVDKVP
jgi:hypothetical protein